MFVRTQSTTLLEISIKYMLNYKVNFISITGTDKTLRVDLHAFSLIKTVTRPVLSGPVTLWEVTLKCSRNLQNI